MSFSPQERDILLAVRGVGPTVVQRIEEYGINDLATLAAQSASDLNTAISVALGASCWRNSPLARAAIEGAIAAARDHTSATSRP
jgi:predicted flap endonuclease-1-like 5' DNA nuclease